MRGWLLPIVILLGLLGIWLRFGCWNEPLWVDELHTSWCTLGDWSQLSERAAAGNQSPLYFAAQKLLGSSLNDWGQGLRWSSLCASGCLIAVLIFLSDRWTKSPLAVAVAAAWVVADADSVFYSIEARPYAILMLVSTLHVVLGFGRLRLLLNPQAKSNGHDWRIFGLRGGWVLTAALMVHLHYTALLVLCVEGIVMVLAWGCYHWRHRYETTVESKPQQGLLSGWASLLVEVGVVVLLVAPLTTGLVDVGGRRRAWGEFVSGSWDQAWPLLRLGIGVVVLPGLGLLVAWLWRWLVHCFRGTESSSICPPRAVFVEPSRCLWLMSIGIGTIILAAGLTYSELAPVLLVRYLVAALPIGALCGGLIVGSISGPWVRLGTTIVCLCFLASTDRVVQHWWHTGTWPPARIEGWDDCAATINENRSDDWPVVLYPGLIEERQLSVAPSEGLKEYLRFPLQSAYPIEGDPRRLIPASSSVTPIFPVESMTQLQQSGGLWVVVRDRPNQPAVLWRVLEALNQELSKSDSRFTVDRFQYGAVHLLKVRRLGAATSAESLAPVAS